MSKPTQLSEADRRALENTIGEVTRAGQDAADAQLEQNYLMLQLRKRYELVNGDTIDPTTGGITRPASSPQPGRTLDDQLQRLIDKVRAIRRDVQRTPTPKGEKHHVKG